MNSEKFFKWVWRLNGLILLIGVTAILVIVSYEFSKDRNYRAPEPIVVGIAEDPEGKEKWSLGHPTHVSGTDYMLIPLESENNEVEEKGISRASKTYSFYSDYSHAPAKNILFLNYENNDTRWLFESVNQLILSVEEFPYSYSGNEKQSVTKAIFYRVVTKDTSGDKKLSKEDEPMFALTRPDGTGFEVILHKYDRIMSKLILENGNLFILYQLDGIAYGEKYSLNPFKSLSRIKLPRIEG